MDDWQLAEPLLAGIRLTPNDRINGLIDKLNYPRFIMVPAGAKNLINGGLQRRWPVSTFAL